MSEDRAGVLGKAQERALDVGVAVDESRQEIGAIEVYGFGCLIVTTDAGDDSASDNDIPFFDFAGEDVNDAPACQQQIAGRVTPGHSYDPFPVHTYSSSSIQTSGR